jgi:hypothetical protein
MFHFNLSLRQSLALLVLLSGMLLGHSVQADELESVDTISTPKTLQFTTISLEYLSWEELLRVDSGTQLDNAYANFYGNGISIDHEIYHSSRAGVAYTAAFLLGQANAGGTQTTLTYQTSFKKWYGGLASARYSYRMTPTTTVSAGPMALVRKMSWPDEGTGYSLKSGADLNVGLLGELGLRLTRKWEARLEMGTLFFKASTYWSVGRGNK